MVTSEGLQKRMIAARMDLARKDVLNLSAIWQKVQEAIAAGKTMLHVSVDLSAIEGVKQYFTSYGLGVHTSKLTPEMIVLSWQLSEE